jgi:hypothetical protein
MTRIWLAFSCFFRLLFGARLPAAAARYLPAAPTADPAHAAPPPGQAEAPAPTKTRAEPKAESKEKRESRADHHRDGALAVLGLLQRRGRLVDFLRESIDGYDDAEIGAAVRDIHCGCAQVLAEYVTFEPVMPGEEEAVVTVPVGFDPGEIRLIGKVAGEPPFRGVLRHHGWRAVRTELPTLSEGVDRRVVAPAEVEIG